MSSLPWMISRGLSPPPSISVVKSVAAKAADSATPAAGYKPVYHGEASLPAAKKVAVTCSTTSAGVDAGFSTVAKPAAATGVGGAPFTPPPQAQRMTLSVISG